MHFGLVAFDLFYEMYLEELENAGQPGWPEIKDQRLKIKDESEIPVAIVENNLYGIDIDLRAIQLSALTLYLKVKAKNREAHIQKLNLTYTDLPPIPEKEMDVFVNTISLSHPIASELLRKILPELNKAYYLGSLLKIEQVVQDFIREKRRQLEKQPIAAIADYGQQVFESPDGFWQAIKKDILHGLQEMLERQTNGKQRVAGHAIQELGLIDALMKKYDVVVTNPPYAGRRNIVAKLAEELKNNYPINASDLYAAFIQRNSELVSENGFIGMITQQSFMFTSSFKELREYLLKKFSISTLQQFGPKAFEGMGGDKISTCTFVLNKTKNPWEVKGIYFRLTAERFCDKRLAFEKALTNWQDSGEHATDRHIFVVRQEDFKAIPGWPLVYWVSEGMREIFEQNNTIEAISDVALGMTTGDNFRVLRYVWEVGFNKKHYFNYNNKKDYLSRWYLYSKGGDYNKWFGNQDFVINWSNNGQEIKNMSSYPRAQNFYFKEGATYSLSVFPICFRYLPPGFIFDVQGSSLFSERQTIIFFIGFLNSKIISYFLQMLNPTMVYQVGDIARLPYPDVSQYLELVQTIEQKAQTCIHLKRSLVQQEPTSWEYIAPPDWQTGFQERLWKEYRLTVLESEISEMVYRLYEVGEEDIRQIEAEFGPLPTRGINLATDLHRLSQMNEIIDSSETDELKQAIRLIKKYYLEKHIPEEAFKSDEVLAEEAEAGKSSGKSRRQARYLTFEEVCIASGYHPDTVYQIIAEAGWERPEERFALAYNWLEYAIGILMGRFKPGVKGELGSGIIHQNDFVTGSLTINEDEFEEITRFFPTDHTDEQGKHRFTPELAETLRAFVDPDGIMVLDAGHSDDLPGKVEEVLTVMLDEHTAQQIIATLVGDVSGDRQKFRRFLERDFFSKHHLKMYRKRPIYWLLQSAKKNYGFYIFHERIDQDTLYKLQRLYIDPKLNWLQQKLESLHNQWLAADNVEKRRLDRERENIEDLIDEIKEFAQKIDRVIRRQDENGRQVGYAPDINDGVILNMAPLHELIPWNEPAKYWQELDEGRYDWAHIAMRYWPNRVKAKCKTDKSLAIAHGVEGEGKQN
ncbi:BREX-1 system adenine-specific DNA-methyltransferase PglX [Calditrichota bacterium GD2]